MKKIPPPSEKEAAVQDLIGRLAEARYGRAGEDREKFAREYVDALWARGLRPTAVRASEAWKATTGNPVEDKRPSAYEEARAANPRLARPATPPPRRDQPGAA